MATEKLAIVHGIKTAHKVIAVAEVWTYDVWGNSRDGFDVNDRNCIERAAEFVVSMEISNVPAYPGASDKFRKFPSGGSFSAEFAVSFSLSDKQIAGAFGLRPSQIETTGDDLRIDVSLVKNSRPVGEILITGWRGCDDDKSATVDAKP